MIHELHFSPAALDDLDEIYDYILTDLGNPGAAGRTVYAILDTLDALREFPLMGTPLSSVARVESDYRFLVSGSYMAFYRPGTGHVYIDRVLYGRRDYLRILMED